MSLPKVRISVFKWNPWLIIQNGNVSTAEGILIELYQALKNTGVFNHELQVAINPGSMGPDNRWTGIMSSLVNNETDLAGPYFLDEAKMKFIDFSSPLEFAQLVLMTGMVPSDDDPFLAFRIFSFQVWLMILSSSILCAFAALLTYTVLPSTRAKVRLEFFLRSLWNFLVSLLGKEFGANDRTFLRQLQFRLCFRILQGTWFVTGLILMYTFQGTITSAFSSGKLLPKHQSLEDLLQDTRTEISTFTGSFPSICLAKLTSTRFESVWTRAQKNLKPNPMGIPKWLDLVEEGKLTHVAEGVYAKYMIGERFRLTGQCGIRVVPLSICSTYLALATRKNLSESLLIKINRKILHFNEGGISKRKKTEALLFYESCTHHKKSSKRPLDISQFLAAFLVLGSGLATSGMYFMMEIFALSKYCLRRH